MDDAGTGARNVAVSFFGFASLIEEDDPKGVIQVAQSNLDLIDSFLGDVLKLPDPDHSGIPGDGHELMRTERHRQIEDLESLEKPLSGELIREVRERNTGKSLLGQYWYP
jgi:hypothetical protein